jgi:hypothetical protein
MSFLKLLTGVVMLAALGFLADGTLVDLGLLLLVEGGVLFTLVVK